MWKHEVLKQLWLSLTFLKNVQEEVNILVFRINLHRRLARVASFTKISPVCHMLYTSGTDKHTGYAHRNNLCVKQTAGTLRLID